MHLLCIITTMAYNPCMQGFTKYYAIIIIIITYVAGPPPPPSGIDYSLKETNQTLISFNLTWNSNFNSEYALTSYIIIIPDSTTEENSMLTCPHSCSPHVPCQCNGLARGNDVAIAISAVNCGNQQGISMEVIIASGIKLLLDTISYNLIGHYRIQIKKQLTQLLLDFTCNMKNLTHPQQLFIPHSTAQL